MSVKGAIYFNIFECGRNLLDQLDVTYQCSFTASKATSSVPKGIYQISPAQVRYYDIMVDHVKEKNVGMDKDKIRKSISHVKSEDEEEMAPSSDVNDTEPSLLHNHHARGDCSHRISSYTL